MVRSLLSFWVLRILASPRVSADLPVRWASYARSPNGPKRHLGVGLVTESAYSHKVVDLMYGVGRPKHLLRSETDTMDTIHKWC